eukprot:TRINITY_DN23908_c0_g1_i1.p1 TRINITY_DN23908_c0_g1~~TRINITY_DN23908_c0_g1_i1.p1  ORF type:complete len:442 (-),score=42.93 TRINITY_DN23908_c0_g1_i1:104-1429(-)
MRARLLSCLSYCACFIGAVRLRIDIYQGAEHEQKHRPCPNGMALESGKCTYDDIEFQDGIVNVQAAFAKFIVAGLFVRGDLAEEVKSALSELQRSSLAKDRTFSELFFAVTQLLSFSTKIGQGGTAVFKTIGAALEAAVVGATVKSQALWLAAFSSTPNAMAIGSLFIFVKYALDEVRKERKLTSDWETATSFARVLHVKSTCVSDMFNLEDMHKRYFKPEVVDTCSVAGLSRLSDALKRSHAALLNLFTSVGRIGKCLYARGSEGVFREKVLCIVALKSKLYRYNKHEGILLQALKLAEVYGTIADEMLAEPYYGRTLHNIAKLGDSFQNASGVLNLQVPSTIKGHEARDQFKAVTCLSMTAVLHGFSETFQTLASALLIWMRSYARNLGSYIDVMSPCRKILRSLAEPGDRMCIDASELPTIKSPCSSAFTEPIWTRKP